MISLVSVSEFGTAAAIVESTPVPVQVMHRSSRTSNARHHRNTAARLSTNMSKRKSLMNVVVAGSAAFLLLTATPVWAADATAIKIGNFTFGPQELKVKAGTTVTWANEDDIPHTVVSPNNFRSKVLDTDGAFSFTFTTPGTYKYFCSLHPHMTGTIVVETATGSITPP
jgi:plastocyanin